MEWHRKYLEWLIGCDNIESNEEMWTKIYMLSSFFYYG